MDGISGDGGRKSLAKLSHMSSWISICCRGLPSLSEDERAAKSLPTSTGSVDSLAQSVALLAASRTSHTSYRGDLKYLLL
ncbi:hypothetical protein BASA61_003873 [Batrachochytrium salamandrivorans]|nr:hypothetical protein BASA61_003873 [Batrachochytrium salamandrivorans]